LIHKDTGFLTTYYMQSAGKRIPNISITMSFINDFFAGDFLLVLALGQLIQEAILNNQSNPLLTRQ
jgi:hypothetical protein